MSGAPVAAIDVGTNTVLLLVARAGAGGRLEELRDRCETARLGAGLARSGTLDPRAVERTLAALARCAEEARALGVEPGRMRAVGTAALRRASDAAGFLALVRERLGIAIEVLSEEDEARLAHAAVVGDGSSAETAILDVGGGSTEVVGAGGRLRLSAPVGAVALTETYLGLDGAEPLEPGGWCALRAAVADACTHFPAGLAAGAGTELVGLGGSAVNLACLHQGLSAFDAGRAEGWRLPAAAAGEQAERMQALDLEARRRLPIEPERAEILPAGLACIAGALERLGAAALRVSARGLRYGVARELLGG